MNETNASSQTAIAEAPASKTKPQARASVNGQLTGKECPSVNTCNRRSDGQMTKRQVAILSLLAKADKPLTLEKLAKGLKTNHPKVVRWSIGSTKEKTAMHRDPFSLLSRGHVKEVAVPVDGVTDYLYSITKSGKAALKVATE